MGAWSPREAAEYRAAADAELLRRIARTDAAARRGIHRLAGIARVAGYGEITAPPAASAVHPPPILPASRRQTRHVRHVWHAVDDCRSETHAHALVRASS